MTGTGSRILLVEDDDTLSGLLARALRGHGYAVEVVRSAEDADLRLTSGSRPGMVLLDVNLPGESGWSLFRRGILGAPGSPPTVVTSAVPVAPARLHEFGVAGYLPKPFSLAGLLGCVERLGMAAAKGPSLEEVDA